jgi:hypothetical protein
MTVDGGVELIFITFQNGPGSMPDKEDRSQRCEG